MHLNVLFKISNDFHYFNSCQAHTTHTDVVYFFPKFPNCFYCQWNRPIRWGAKQQHVAPVMQVVPPIHPRLSVSHFHSSLSIIALWIHFVFFLPLLCVDAGYSSAAVEVGEKGEEEETLWKVNSTLSVLLQQRAAEHFVYRAVAESKWLRPCWHSDMAAN